MYVMGEKYKEREEYGSQKKNWDRALENEAENFIYNYENIGRGEVRIY